MFFLLSNGEGVNTKDYKELGRIFYEGFCEKFQQETSECVFVKKRKKNPVACLKKTVSGTCYCKKHFSSERKEYIRTYFERNGLYITRDRPILQEFLDILQQNDSWNVFSNVLHQGLNTLSLNIQLSSSSSSSVSSTSSSASEFDLIEIARIIREHHDAISFTKVKKSQQTNVTGIAFNNVIEFVVLQEHGVLNNEIINASVKIWHNQQIHICGCRTLMCAFRLASSVIRVLRKHQVMKDIHTISYIKPVFANASFDFFQQTLIIRELQKKVCLISEYCQTENITVTLDSNTSGCKRTTCAIFCFQKNGLTTSIKVYPRGNFIITANNFDGHILRKGIDAIRHAVHVSSQNVCLYPNSYENIQIPQIPKFTYDFFWKQMDKNVNLKRKFNDL